MSFQFRATGRGSGSERFKLIDVSQKGFGPRHRGSDRPLQVTAGHLCAEKSRSSS